jgi:hypothetical protein
VDYPAIIPPWDQIRYFQSPRETAFAGLTTATSIALADPNRVGLLLSASGDLSVAVSLNSGVSQGQGLLLSPGDRPFLITHEQVGVIVQMQWFAIGYGTGSNLTVIEILLASWPGSGGVTCDT